MEQPITIKTEKIEIEIKAEPYDSDDSLNETENNISGNATFIKQDKSMNLEYSENQECGNQQTVDKSNAHAWFQNSNDTEQIIKIKDDSKEINESKTDHINDDDPQKYCQQTLRVDAPEIPTPSTENSGQDANKSPIMCIQCGKTFKTQPNLKKHIKYVHSTDQRVECKDCLKSFKSILYLRSHIRSVHAKTEYLKCPHCDKVCVTKKKLNDHIYCTHKTEEDKVDCTVCGKVFKGRTNLKVHMRYVHADGQIHTCPICNKTFKVDMLLQRHIKWAHPADGTMYKCQTCSKVLPSLKGFKTHMKNVHFYEKAICDLCKRSFKTKQTLERHLRKVHYEQAHKKTVIYKPKDFKCQFCDRTFLNSTSLYWHIDRFHSEKELPQSLCIICNKELSDYATLLRHLQSVHSIETAKCTICSKEFKSPINLQNHMRITHAPPEAEQKCEMCQKTFKCALHLRMHMLYVHDGGTYTCELCQKTFTSNKYLSKHMKCHNNSRDFKCDICQKMFKSAYSVNKHKKLVHDRIKCNICHFKQKDIQEHMRNAHPGIEYVNLYETETSSNAKPKRKRNRNKKGNANECQNTQGDNIISENMNLNVNQEYANLNDQQHMNVDVNILTKDIKIEPISEITCEVCNKTVDNGEFSEHSMYCKTAPILEVSIKTEIKEEII